MAIGLNSLIALLIIIVGVLGVLAAATGDAAPGTLGVSIFVAVGCLVMAVVVCGIVAILGDIRNQLLLLNSKVNSSSPK
jgi:predicted membrane channel-forming protein YqfA (hemolysin III family)